MKIKKAVRRQARLRLALMGPPGSGKTYTALLIAKGIGGKILVIDTERGSSKKYAGLNGMPEFDIIDDMREFSPAIYTEAIHQGEAEKYDVIIIDSLSHAWEGKGGAKELVDRAIDRQKVKNSFTAWGAVTPLHRGMIDAMLQSSAHIIATMRVKTEYVIENVNGRNVPRKIGLTPLQREGMEFEFDLIADIDNAKMHVSKSRIPGYNDEVFDKPGAELGKALATWLNEGEAEPVKTAEELAAEAATQTQATSDGEGPYEELLHDENFAEPKYGHGETTAPPAHKKPDVAITENAKFTTMKGRLEGCVSMADFKELMGLVESEWTEAEKSALKPHAYKVVTRIKAKASAATAH